MPNTAAVEQGSGILRTLDGYVNQARGAAAVVVASLALGALGAAVKASFDTDAAIAQAPSARLAKPNKPGHIQEYLNVTASDGGGAPLKLQKNTFTFSEQCISNGRKVTRHVVYNRPDQPMGSCDAGKPVTVTAKAPLQGEWLIQSDVRKKVQHATRKNNHFSFIEQVVGGSPQPASPSAPPASTPNSPPPPDGGEPEPANPYAPGNVGVDISWPQCDTPDETPTGADFGVVGVTNGVGYSTNPCLGAEAANFPGKKLNLYVNTGWNSSSVHIDPNSPRVCATGDENCLAYNYGYNAGLYAVDAATSTGIDVRTVWWKDVESDATWSSDTSQNVSSLQGETDALMDSGATMVGDYSTTVQWNNITGNWQNGEPSWGSTTWTTASDARTYCSGHQFTGGPSFMMQFLPPGQIDHNVVC